MEARASQLMESFFTRKPDATWPKAGRLHIYALPRSDAVAAIAAPYQDFITARGLPNLSLQPLQWLHLSVERFNVYLDELMPAQITTLREALKQHLAVVPAFDLQVGPALVATHTITLDAVPDEPWRDLRSAVRQAATEALGPDAVSSATGHGRPHVTISYSTGHLDIEPHLGALNHVRAGRATFPVTTAHLLAVHQHADAGTYSWRPIDTFPLRA
jgi:hypothetical protein